MKSFNVNLNNNFGSKLNLVIYNYNENAMSVYEKILNNNDFYNLNLLFDNLLIFFRYKKNYALFTPITLLNDSQLNLTNSISKIKNVFTSGENDISIIMENISDYRNIDNCIPLTENLCVNVKLLLKDILNYKIKTNYECWCYYDGSITELSDEFSTKSNYIQFLVPYNNFYYLTGILNLSNIGYGQVINVDFDENINDMYYIVNQENIDIGLSINTENFMLSNYENGYIELNYGNKTFYIDSNIFGESVFISNKNFSNKYYIFEYNTKDDLNYYELSFEDLIYIKFLKKYVAICYQVNKKFTLSQIMSFENSPKIAKLNFVDVRAEKGDLELNAGVYTNLKWTITDIFSNITMYLKNSYQYITLVSDEILDLYIFNFENDNYITDYKNVNGPKTIYLLYKNLQIIYYDGEKYNLFQIGVINENNLTITLSTNKTLLNSIVYLENNSTLNTLIVNNLSQYINVICTNDINYVCNNSWIKMGSYNNVICVDNVNLLKNVTKPRFIFNSQLPLQLYFINYENEMKDVININLEKFNNLYTSNFLSFNHKFLQIIYTLDNINFGMYSLCNLSEVLKTGCVINLLSQSTTNKKIVELMQGNNFLFIINQNINKAITFQDNASCLNSSCLPLSENLCLNEKMILSVSSNQNSNSNNYFLVMVQIAIFFGILIMVFIIIVYLYVQ